MATAPRTQRQIYLQWDILFEPTVTKEIKDTAIKELLKSISRGVKSKANSIPLNYDVFKSESNKLLYTLRVYAGAPAEKKVSKTRARSAMAEPDDTDTSPAIPLSGPIHPPGSPSRPPGVAEIQEVELLAVLQ